MRRARSAVSSFLLLAAACGGKSDGGTGPGPGDLGYLVQSSVAPPSTAPVSSSLPITVKILHRESGGTTTPAAGRSVTFTVTAGGGTVGGAASTVATTSADGSVSTTWQLGTTPGPQTLRGSISSTEYLDFTLTATALPPTQVALSTPPSAGAASGAPLAQQPVVQLKDGAGGNVAQAGVAVTATIESGGGTLGGTTTASTNSTGAATFADLSISGIVGNRTLKFTATLGGTAVSVTSAAIALAAGAPAQMVIVIQPSATTGSGSPLGQQPAVQLQDAAGNNSTQAGVTITAGLASGAGTLGGTATASTDATGKATFSDLSVTGVPGQVTLKFSATLGSQTSNVISEVVSLVAPGTLSIVTQPTTNPQNGVQFFQQPVVQLLDIHGQPLAQAGVPVSVVSTSGTAILSAGFAAAAPPALAPGGPSLVVNTDATGQARFGDLTLTGSGTNTLTFSAPGYTPATSAPLAISGAPNAPPIGFGNIFSSVSGAAGSFLYYRTSLPPGSVTDWLHAYTFGGTGNAQLYARQGLYPTGTDFDCASTGAGASQDCDLRPGSAGDWFFLVKGGSGGFTNVTLRPATYEGACTPVQMPLGVLLDETWITLPSNSCHSLSSTYYYNLYDLDLPTSQAVAITAHWSTFQLAVLIKDLNTPSLSGLINGPINLFGPGTVHLQVGSASSPGQTLTYQLMASPASASVPDCNTKVWAWDGADATLNLGSAACVSLSPGGGKSNRFAVIIGRGQTLTVTMSSAAFDPYLRLLSDTNPFWTTVVAQDNNGGGGTTARIVYANPTGGALEWGVEATSLNSAATGNYNIKFSLSPGYFNAPPASTAHP